MKCNGCGAFYVNGINDTPYGWMCGSCEVDEQDRDAKINMETDDERRAHDEASEV